MDLIFIDSGLTPAEFLRQQLKITHLDKESEKVEMKREELEDEMMNDEKNKGYSFYNYADFVSIVQGTC